jgi:hypothetical protein
MLSQWRQPIPLFGTGGIKPCAIPGGWDDVVARLLARVDPKRFDYTQNAGVNPIEISNMGGLSVRLFFFALFQLALCLIRHFFGRGPESTTTQRLRRCDNFPSAATLTVAASQPALGGSR